MKDLVKSLFKKRSALSVDQRINRRTFISFAVFTIAGVSAIKGWFWLRIRPAEHGIKVPLRRVLDGNEQIFEKTFSPNHLAKTYPKSAAAKKVRLNGKLGLKSALDPEWKLKVVRPAGNPLLLGLDDIKKLPKTEFAFEFKCIEGWSQISHWGGVKFSDFAEAYDLNAETAMKYISLVTEDKKYYVGIDMPSAMHPQTLLCYEMNAEPLPMDHGYPLRLIIPVKYGIKNLKRIGTLSFSNERPADYWYERGYDYYSGL